MTDLETRPHCLGYISSGRMKADIKRDEAIAERDLAHRCFRWNWPGAQDEGRTHMRRALRAWKNFRYFKARIKQ